MVEHTGSTQAVAGEFPGVVFEFLSTETESVLRSLVESDKTQKMARTNIIIQ
jgi:hypothetical protein